MSGSADPTMRIRELLAIMERLRAVDGCPWDRQQTFASIAPYTIEEAYEVADAVEQGDMRHLKEELGDLLFQVVFHAQMASEAQAFDFDQVAGAICDKLLRRHPHVFGASGPLTAAQQNAAWEDIKARERASRLQGPPSHLDGVPQALPALMRAFKLSKRAARVGFDFEHPSQTADKVAEELAEVRDAAAAHGGRRGHLVLVITISFPRPLVLAIVARSTDSVVMRWQAIDKSISTLKLFISGSLLYRDIIVSMQHVHHENNLEC